MEKEDVNAIIIVHVVPIVNVVLNFYLMALVCVVMDVDAVQIANAKLNVNVAQKIRK